jgi:cytochrome c
MTATRRSLACFTLIALASTTLTGLATADDLNFDGHDLVEPNCATMSSWFQCRDMDIDTVPSGVYLGYTYVHLTSSTLGPFGNVTYPDTGAPYVSSITACSSCHFTGGHVPFGTPMYQSPSKYKPNPATGLGPYFGPLGYHRDLEDSILDCLQNCMNADRVPAKDDPVMVAMVEYIHWVADGITDPAMKENWNLLPPEAGAKLPTIAGIASMHADPVRGGLLYANQCSDCHDKDGPGQGEFRTDEERPRIPALWGVLNGFTRGAAFHRNTVLAAYVQKHMPYDAPATLSNQDALDIAAYINAPDKPRGDGLANIMYCFNDPDGIPAALRKSTDWLVGCEYPGEREHFESLGIDYEDMVRNGPWTALSAWRDAKIAELLAAQACPPDFDQDGTVGAADLGIMLGAWGTANAAADLDDNGTVQSADLGILLGEWGPCN